MDQAHPRQYDLTFTNDIRKRPISKQAHVLRFRVGKNFVANTVQPSRTTQARTLEGSAQTPQAPPTPGLRFMSAFPQPAQLPGLAP